MDNIAYQPKRGNWLIQEDGDGPAVDVVLELTGWR